jgi:hypothetical protein
MTKSILRHALTLALLAPSCLFAAFPDHEEFDATLHVPYRGTASEARDFTLRFSYPGQGAGIAAAWRLDVHDEAGKLVRHWQGTAKAGDGEESVTIAWDGRDAAGTTLRAGVYYATLGTAPGTPTTLDASLLAATSDHPLRNIEPATIQTWPLQIGEVAAAVLPAFQAMAKTSRLGVAHPDAVATPDSVAFTVYYGDLHSQSNHSDGGGPLATCHGAQNPLAAPFGPSDAFQYAYDHGLDILMSSEHNHMFDGSTGTNSSATPATAHNLYQSGLSQAATFNQNHPGFLALYGMEWGVISNGGHMNIFGENSLYEWEYNSSNQLIGDIYTPKSDYAAVYATMRARNVIGQFNHPDTSGQFLIGSTSLGYNADGDEVMALSEVMNSSAFSVNTTETETSRSSYESAWKKMLEAGYHVAPSTDQDNHCANWGASYTNRTAVLIPNDTSLSTDSFMEALRARRVFATMDKTAQLVLTSGDYVMGARFDNAGPLNLNVLYSNASGHSANLVQIYEGVPGRNGTATVASTTAIATLNPTLGLHYYYAKITQDDGKLLWSAPVWVRQIDPSDVVFRDGFGAQ